MKLIRLEKPKRLNLIYIVTGTIVNWICHFIWNYYFRLSKHTERPNKHENSVTNSSHKIILWFSKVIHTEKALIRMNLVCYVYNFFVFVVLSKKRKITVCKQSKLVFLHCLSCGDNTHIFTAIYPFNKINSTDIIILWLLKSGITMLIHKKDDIEFVTKFPCLLGHPVSYWIISQP